MAKMYAFKKFEDKLCKGTKKCAIAEKITFDDKTFSLVLR